MKTTFTTDKIDQIIWTGEIEVLEDSVSILIDSSDYYLNASLITSNNTFNCEFWNKEDKEELSDDVLNHIYKKFTKLYGDSIYGSKKYLWNSWNSN